MSSNADASPPDYANLYSKVDKLNIHGLNLSVPETARDVIKPWDSRDSTDTYAESNVDDQLIIHIPFIESVRIKSILIKTGRGELAPQNLNVYVNAPTIIDFSDAESGNVKAQLEVALKTDEPGVVEYPVRAAVLGNVMALSLVLYSEGGDASRIYYVGFKGDIRTQRSVGTSALEVPAAGTADAKLVEKAKSKTGASQQTTAR
ncbi:galactose-binding domain-like protein [Amanita rubescens]|nr:galactose-binding domain-like protein [Amanita rubescens]